MTAGKFTKEQLELIEKAAAEERARGRQPPNPFMSIDTMGGDDLRDYAKGVFGAAFSNPRGVDRTWKVESPKKQPAPLPTCAVCRKPVQLVHRVDDPFEERLTIVIVCHGSRQIVREDTMALSIDDHAEIGVKEAFRATVVLRKRAVQSPWRRKSAA